MHLGMHSALDVETERNQRLIVAANWTVHKPLDPRDTATLETLVFLFPLAGSKPVIAHPCAVKPSGTSRSQAGPRCNQLATLLWLRTRGASLGWLGRRGLGGAIPGPGRGSRQGEGGETAA